MGGGGGDVQQSHGSRAQQGKATSRGRAGRGGGGLMLASMLDILMTILFYLMKNFSSSQQEFSVAKDLKLPLSSATAEPTTALQLLVSQNYIIVDDKQVVVLKNGDVDKADLFNDGITITKLAQELKEQKERSLYIQKVNDAMSFTGTLVLQADATTSFNLLKKVLYTAGISDFVNLKLAVLKKDQG